MGDAVICFISSEVRYEVKVPDMKGCPLSVYKSLGDYIGQIFAGICA